MAGIGIHLIPGGSNNPRGLERFTNAAARIASVQSNDNLVIQDDTNELWYWDSETATWTRYYEPFASAVEFVPSGTIAATDVQAALQELDGDIQAHLADPTDAHDASAISFVPGSGIAATDAQAAIEEAKNDSIAYTDAHINDAVDAHDASAISFAPSGSIAATEVQAAIQELDSETDARLDDLEASNTGVGYFNSGALPVVNASTITPADKRRQKYVVSGNGGAVTVGNVDTTGMQDGDELLFVGGDNTNTVTFQDAANVVSQGPCVLALDESLKLTLNSTKWTEESRSN